MKQYDGLRSQELGSNTSLREQREYDEQNNTALDGRARLHPAAARQPTYKQLVTTLTAWVNSYIKKDHMVVRDLISDLSDGHLLLAFITRLTNEQIPYTVDGAGEKSQRINVSACVRFCETLGMQQSGRFSVDGILGRDIVSVLCLLVDLVHVVGCPYVLPAHVSIAVVRDEAWEGGVRSRTSVHAITGDEGGHGPARWCVEPELLDPVPVPVPDAFDKLFEDRDKVAQVSLLIREFVNQKFEGMNIEVDHLALEFHDGVYLILLIGTMGHFFVPLNFYHLSPKNAAQKLENVRFAFKLMAEMEISTVNFNAVDLVRRDLKACLRCLYAIFTHYTTKK
ncbi:hypothetical protein SeLEV6574_g02057 [Synchytrium endobioticum]|uniref:Calponin-homology (CH) domain-containing protein n=1 Tax=Synchytrium endobioticum TaxID=286115 RepID=A0A507D9U7_9FUNG|nr:hypothetical protein SeLEV6574_g02057 [Synchytrium endobioticum]